MSDIVWEEPPPQVGGKAPGGRGKWEGVFDELRKHPGAWAKIADDASPSLATVIKKGEAKGCEPGEFEAVVRVSGRIDGRCAVYARYIGEASDG